MVLFGGGLACQCRRTYGVFKFFQLKLGTYCNVMLLARTADEPPSEVVFVVPTLSFRVLYWKDTNADII